MGKSTNPNPKKEREEGEERREREAGGKGEGRGGREGTGRGRAGKEAIPSFGDPNSLGHNNTFLNIDREITRLVKKTKGD